MNVHLVPHSINERRDISPGPMPDIKNPTHFPPLLEGWNPARTRQFIKSFSSSEKSDGRPEAWNNPIRTEQLIQSFSSSGKSNGSEKIVKPKSWNPTRIKQLTPSFLSNEGSDVGCPALPAPDHGAPQIPVKKIVKPEAWNNPTRTGQLIESFSSKSWNPIKTEQLIKSFSSNRRKDASSNTTPNIKSCTHLSPLPPLSNRENSISLSTMPDITNTRIFPTLSSSNNREMATPKMSTENWNQIKTTRIIKPHSSHGKNNVASKTRLDINNTNIFPYLPSANPNLPLANPKKTAQVIKSYSSHGKNNAPLTLIEVGHRFPDFRWKEESRNEFSGMGTRKVSKWEKRHPH